MVEKKSKCEKKSVTCHLFFFFFNKSYNIILEPLKTSANKQPRGCEFGSRRLLLAAHLCTFSSCGTHGPAEDLLDDIGQQADGDEQDDAEPGRAARQHLHEDVVHPLVVEEGPEAAGVERRKKKKKRVNWWNGGDFRNLLRK